MHSPFFPNRHTSTASFTVETDLNCSSLLSISLATIEAKLRGQETEGTLAVVRVERYSPRTFRGLRSYNVDSSDEGMR